MKKKTKIVFQAFIMDCAICLMLVVFHCYRLLLLSSSGELRVHYYDFEEKISINIEIAIPIYDPKNYIPRHIKLCSRSIWILTYMLGMVSSIDVISMKKRKNGIMLETMEVTIMLVYKMFYQGLCFP